MTTDADRHHDQTDRPKTPTFGIAELTDLERRMQGILDPDDAIEAVFVALEWLAYALPTAGLAIVPAGKWEEAWRKVGGPRDDVHHIPRGHEPTDRPDWEQVVRYISPWQPVEPHNAEDPDERHCHGADCCWACFASKPTHSQGTDDQACRTYRDIRTGRCGYEQNAETPVTGESSADDRGGP